MIKAEPPRSKTAITSVDRLRDLMMLHFHPEWGSAYWLKRQAQLGWDVRDRVRTHDDLWLLGSTPLADLQRFPVRSFVPRALHGQFARFIVGETAGTSGVPCATVYRDDEYHAAFVAPFMRVAEATNFPREKPWLWVGPSGPHIIGKVARELARHTGCMDPFSVDFDPRWAKRLAEGSIARQRYLDHVTAQAIDVLEREEVGVLFITPPALAALVIKLSDAQRETIHGIHYGGISLTPDAVNDFRAAFPRAVHLAGYGNTLFGVAMEVADGHRLAMDYHLLDDRVHLHIADCPHDDAQSQKWPPRLCKPGQSGRVLFHRLDESCLLVGVMERDEAERILPSPHAVEVGAHANGLRNPRTPATLVRQLQIGLY